jgi:uncharacterized membrane protein
MDAAATTDGFGRWAWLVGGGALAVLGLSRRSPAGVGVAAGGAVLVYRAVTGHFPTIRTENRLRIERSVTVNRSRDEVFAMWRGSERLPLLLGNLETTHFSGEDTLRRITSALFGRSMQWDVEIAEERLPEYIAWRSAPGALVPQLVSVLLSEAPADRGTVVLLAYECVLPIGPLGTALAPVGRRIAESRIRDKLRQFKALIDTGEVPTTEGQPRGQRDMRRSA